MSAFLDENILKILTLVPGLDLLLRDLRRHRGRQRSRRHRLLHQVLPQEDQEPML
jgi:hypothetical protein